MRWDCKLFSLVEIINKKLLLLLISIVLITILIGSIVTVPFQIDDVSAPVYQGGKKIVKKQLQGSVNGSCSGPLTGKETLDSEDAIKFNKKGIALAKTGKYEEAIENYDRALEEEPNAFSILNNKGNSLYHLGKYVKAIEYFDKALYVDPSLANAFFGKGVSLHKLGEFEEAIENYDRALDKQPNVAGILKAKGDTLYYLGKYDEAIEQYDLAVAKDPDCYSNLKRLAQDKLDNKNNGDNTKNKRVVTKVPIKKSEPIGPTTTFASGGNMTPTSPPSIIDNNTPPVSSDSSIITTIDKPIDTQLLASDKDNDELTASIVSAPSSGILSDINQENGMVTYTPNSGFTGTDSFMFKVNDGQADSNSAQITVAINQENNPPAALDTTVTTNMDRPIDITLPASDPDQSDELTASIVSAPSSGILSDINQENGMVTYTPNSGSISSDTFTFKVNDGKVDSNSGIIKIAVSTGYQDDCKEVPTQVTEYPPIKDSKSATTNSKALLQNMKNCDPITSITPTPTTTDNNNNIVPPLTSIGDVNSGSSGEDIVSGATTTTKGSTNTPLTNPATQLDAGTNKGVVGTGSSTSHSPTDGLLTGCEDGPLQMYIKGPWKFSYQVLKGQGLVIKDFKAGKEHVYNSISVPHFKIESGGKSKIVRFCPDEDPQYWTYQSTDKKFNSLSVDSEKGIDALHWTFYKHFNGENGFKGTLSINYDIVIRWKEMSGKGPFSDVPKCESAQGVECYRFIPKVTYKWEGAGNTKNLDRFAAFYKLDYGSNTGFAPVKDHSSVKVVTETLGKHPMITHETSFLAVDKGKEGKYDNLHTAHPGQTIFVPGCRFNVEFDCAHIHWRWSKLADVMVDPSNDQAIDKNLAGTPNLVPGQTIAIAIVKYHPGEEDPDDPSTLLDGEQIATAEYASYEPIRQGEDSSGDVGLCYNCKLSTTEHTIVWYVASIPNKNSDTFFRHGIFVLDTNPGDERIPIIFIPGIGGTKIFKITPDGDRKEVWPAVRNLGIIDKKALIGMDLKNDGETFVDPAKLELEIIRAVGYPPIGTDFYGKILNYLKTDHGYKEGYDLFPFPYNWILDNAKHFDDLDDKINETLKITGSSKVILIAHSQGGLVSKGYILSKPERSDKVEALITLGTPYGGAPKAFYALVDGYNFDNRDANRKVVKAISQNAPAPYQLLPREPFITDMNDKRKITISESYNSIVYKSMKNDRRTESNVNEWRMNPILLDKANQFWSSFGTPQNPTRIPVDNYVIAGVGTCTLSGYNMKDFDASLFWKVNRIDYSMDDLLFGKFSGTSFKKVSLLPVFADGDETVPLWSSHIKGSTQTWFVKGATHGALAANTQVQTIVGDILNNKNSGSSSPLVPTSKTDPKNYTPKICSQGSESMLPPMYMLSFSGEQFDQKSKFEGKTSGTAMLNHDGYVINGKGKVEIKASHNSAQPGKLCEYEFKTKDPNDYYKFTGKWKLEQSKTKQNPQGRLVLDLDSEKMYMEMKKGPQSCAKTYGFGYSLLLVCADSVNIDIAKKEGLHDYTYGKCKFKIYN